MFASIQLVMMNFEMSKSFTYLRIRHKSTERVLKSASLNRLCFQWRPLDGTVRHVSPTCASINILTPLLRRKCTRCWRRAGTPRGRRSRGSSSTPPCSTSRPAPCSSDSGPKTRTRTGFIIVTELVRGDKDHPYLPSKINPQERKQQNWFCVDIFYRADSFALYLISLECL